MLLRFRVAQLLAITALSFGLLMVWSGQARAERGLASWYGPGFYGKTTASGVPYNAYGHTAASKTLPLGTKLLVTYRGNSIPVTVNDRGPYVAGRVLDLSQGAAQDIGLTRQGVGYINYRVLSYPSSSSPGYQSGYGSGSYTTTTPNSGTYVVRPGDTLTSIAGSLGVSAGYLARYNGLANPDAIRSGQTLYY